MAGYTVTVRAKGAVDKQRYEESRPAWDALAAAVRRHEGGPGLEAVDLRVRRFEPVHLVAARVELAGPRGLRCGVDVRGDGSSEAWEGRVRKRLVEPKRRETPVQALRRRLEDRVSEDELRRRYEDSLSWRVTRPLRAAGRLVRRRAPEPAPVPPPAPPRYDRFLDLVADRLAPLEAAGAPPLSAFRALPDDVWALLLTRQYEGWPRIRAALPGVPHPDVQWQWNGTSGAALAAETTAFARLVRERFGRPLAGARVLDFGCGWGRITRFLAREVEPGDLFACDPSEEILAVARDDGVPAELARSDFVPERLPFDGPFDLAYAFSVFTHLSETAAAACLRALAGGLRRGGVLVITVRGPEYLWATDLMPGALESLGPDPAAALREPRYLFVPHSTAEPHPQHGGGEMHYGEAVVTLPYVRERWTEDFELASVDLLIGDLHQVALTLVRR